MSYKDDPEYQKDKVQLYVGTAILYVIMATVMYIKYKKQN